MLPEADWAGRYEQLRQEAIHSDATAAGWGLALLVHRGIVAWMRAWATIPSRESQASRRTVGAIEPLHPVVEYPEFSHQLTAELANIFLDTRQEVMA